MLKVGKIGLSGVKKTSKGLAGGNSCFEVPLLTTKHKYHWKSKIGKTEYQIPDIIVEEISDFIHYPRWEYSLSLLEITPSKIVFLVDRRELKDKEVKDILEQCWWLIKGSFLVTKPYKIELKSTKPLHGDSSISKFGAKTLQPNEADLLGRRYDQCIKPIPITKDMFIALEEDYEWHGDEEEYEVWEEQDRI